MCALILSPANCEIVVVIRFLHTQKQSPAEIHYQLCHVWTQNYGNSMVRRWCRQITEGRTNVHKEDRSGQTSLVMPELMVSVWQVVFCRICDSQFQNSLFSSSSPRCLAHSCAKLSPGGLVFRKCVQNKCQSSWQMNAKPNVWPQHLHSSSHAWREMMSFSTVLLLGMKHGYHVPHQKQNNNPCIGGIVVHLWRPNSSRQSLKK